MWTEPQFPYTEIDTISDWNIMYYYYYDYGDMNWCKHLTQKYFLNEVLNPHMESFLLFSFPSLNVVWQLGIWIHWEKFIHIISLCWSVLFSFSSQDRKPLEGKNHVYYTALCDSVWHNAWHRGSPINVRWTHKLQLFAYNIFTSF